MIHESPFDANDELESAVRETLRSEGVVHFRHDYLWDGEGRQRLLFGTVAGEDGPEAFLAACWKSGGTHLNVRVHMRMPVDVLCARFLPGTGEHAALPLVAHDGYDSAVAAAAGGDVACVGRTADTRRAAYVLRVAKPGDAGKTLAVALARREDGRYSAETPFEAPLSGFREWAAREFGTPSFRP